VLTEYLRTTLALDAIVLLNDYTGKLAVVAGDPGREGLTDTETTAAQWAYDHRDPAGRGTGTLPGAGWFFVPLVGREAARGVLGVRPTGGRRTLDAEQERLLLAMRDQAGVALEKAILAAEVQRSRLMTEADKLRAALLSSVSHDLRTPLVSIKGATTALMELDDALPAADKRELLENVLGETDRLNRYVQNLLDMTRLGYGALKLRRDWCDVRDIFGAAVRDLKSVLSRHTVTTTVPKGEELLFTDAALLEQVLVNLIENAAKYSPAGTSIALAASRWEKAYELSVCDRGSGILPEEREHVFDIFRRAQAADQRTAGTGMGLAICKGFVEALGGTIEITEAGPQGGSCFRVLLPQPRGALPPGPEE
jgi:two-component system sensor histidine kinase KdpD